ncbi:MAG: Txe/YoeB family addiction module toxin [Spirochaetes bacterium]|nr:Txe/YoeB family addiction module toxin [Spirochaetota bacterium]
MKLIFTDESWEDYLYWQNIDKRILRRINELIKDIQREPFSGIGKPKPLKYKLQGCWSRKINDEHRLLSEKSSQRFFESASASLRIFFV